ncbi:hypothetical protein ABLN67_22020, partial [Mycobacterium tuberculosis]
YFVPVIKFGCLTVSSIGGNGVFRIYRETLFPRFSCAASPAPVTVSRPGEWPTHSDCMAPRSRWTPRARPG